MEFNIKFDEELIVETANRVLDEFEYNGKTIREWADLIANPKTNADRIRAMTDEELAEFLETLCPSYNWTMALNGMTWFGWLKQEVDNGDG